MNQSPITPADERIVEPMIEFARCSKRQRIIVAGSTSAKLMFDLHRCGYLRVSTTANCGLPAGQYDVAFVDWRLHSVKALETTLDWLVDFLSQTGVVVIWVDRQKPADNRNLRSALERHGLFVEAGTVREHGCAISARRCEKSPIPKVA